MTATGFRVAADEGAPQRRPDPEDVKMTRADDAAAELLGDTVARRRERSPRHGGDSLVGNSFFLQRHNLAG